jgi:hypothetical protein
MGCVEWIEHTQDEDPVSGVLNMEMKSVFRESGLLASRNGISP